MSTESARVFYDIPYPCSPYHTEENFLQAVKYHIGNDQPADMVQESLQRSGISTGLYNGNVYAAIPRMGQYSAKWMMKIVYLSSDMILPDVHPDWVAP
jgi:hypothetical protein